MWWAAAFTLPGRSWLLIYTHRALPGSKLFCKCHLSHSSVLLLPWSLGCLTTDRSLGRHGSSGGWGKKAAAVCSLDGRMLA